MSFDHLGAIAELKLAATPKLVLFALGNRACSVCGIAWPGKNYLMEMTGLGETSVVKGLKALVDAQLIVIHRYSHGGRGVATEYVVLPNHLKLAKVAPCQDCRKRMKTPREARGLRDHGKTPRLAGGLGVREMSKPPASGGQNPPPGTHHSVSNTSFSQRVDPQSSTSGSASPRLPDTTPSPTSAEDARRRGDEAMREIIAAGPLSPKPRDPR